MYKFKRLIILITTSLVVNCNAQIGTIDASFITGNGLNSGANCVINTSNNKILVGGYFANYDGTTVSKIVRLNNDGSIDNSLTGIISGFNGPINCIIEQPDGKLLCGGGFTSFNGNTRNYLVRLNSDGTEDLTFNIGTGFNSNVLCMILQSDGKIIIGGQFGYFNGSNTYKCIIRLNSNGSIDNTFNSGTGFARTLSGGNLLLNSMVQQSDGKIVIVGEFDTYNGSIVRNIVKLNNNGTIDSNFQIGLGLQSSSGGSDAKCIKLHNDGKLLVSGKFNTYNGNSYNGIVRLNNDGTPDLSFNIGTGFLNPGYSFGYKILSMADSSIIVSNSGSNSINSQTVTSVCVLNYDGSVKYANVFKFMTYDIVYDALIQNDGKIIFVGSFTFYDNVVKNNIVRVNGLLSTDIVESYKTLPFSIFPNPTNDIINIQLDKNENKVTKVILTNPLGEVLINESFSYDKISLTTKQLKNGVYYLTISTDKLMGTKKIIKN